MAHATPMAHVAPVALVATAGLRDRAHRAALNYVLWVFVLTYVVLEVASRAPAPTATGLVLGFPATISKGIVENYLTVLFFTTFALPPAILAWWDRGEAGEE